MPKFPPSSSATAFECPHCGAYTTQHWYRLTGTPLTDGDRLPHIPSANDRDRLLQNEDIPEPIREDLLDWFDQSVTGLPFFDRISQGEITKINVCNLFASECFNCHKLSVWVYKTLVFPAISAGELPNPDLPVDIARDFEEARRVLTLSPRGAAALLRLCVQKLCIFLGEEGRFIDRDIASLVKKGLNPMVQRSLDVVRVIGNEAVHPGSLDLKDDTDTATQLLKLVNLIADQMISHPKSVDKLYESLPEHKRTAIETRNRSATASNQGADQQHSPAD